MDELQLRRNLPEWFLEFIEWAKGTEGRKSWLNSLVWAGAALVGTGVAAGLTGYGVLHLFYDWKIDDYIIRKAMEKFSLATNNGVPYNLINFLDKHAANQPDKLHIVFEDQKFTFKETDLISNFHANALLSLGIGGPNGCDNMALLMKNCPEFVFIVYGSLKIDVKLALLNTNLRLKALLHCIKEAETKILLVDNEPDLLEAIKEVTEELKQEGVRVLVYGKTDEYESFIDVLHYSSDKPINKEFRNADDNPNVTAVYIYTSGTTGLPKATITSHGRCLNIASVYFVFRVNPSDTVYCALPLFHVAGFGIGIVNCLTMGCTLAIGRKFSVRNFWSDCDKHGATVIQYIGETCRYLMSPPPGPQDKQHNIRLAIGNGLRKDIWREFQSRFNIKRIAELYGGSDINCSFANVRSRFGAVGVHSPSRDRNPMIPKIVYLEYDIENECIVRDPVTGLCKTQPLGKPGLLVGQITPRSAFEGYTDSKQTEKKIVRDVLTKGDSFLNSGDILCRNKDYTVHFVDRIGDTFRWKGENVSTIEVGNTITEVESIHDCSAYGVQIPNTDGRACMVALVPEQGVSSTHQEMLDALYKHCEHTLPSYARPIFVRFLEQMIITETFKHQKHKMQTAGFDETKVEDLYVIDHSAKRYVRMTADIQRGIQQGAYKL